MDKVKNSSPDKLSFRYRHTIERLSILERKSLEKHVEDKRFKKEQTGHLRATFEQAVQQAKNKKFDDYERKKLRSAIDKGFKTPANGGGGGHRHYLGVSNLIVRTELNRTSCINFVYAFVHGSREVPKREIEAAVDKALFDYKNNNRELGKKYTKRQNGVTPEGIERYKDYVSRAPKETSFSLLQSQSDISISDDPRIQQITLLETLFSQNDYIYITANELLKLEKQKRYCKQQQNWVEAMHSDSDFAKKFFSTARYMVINPLQKEPAERSGGSKSYRCDAAVADFRHCLVEFDDHKENEEISSLYTLENQIRFWSTFDLYPISALIYSGNKSIHAWLKLPEIKDKEDWDRIVKGEIYSELEAMGADKACSNPSRLTRFPGALNKKTGKYSQLLWLDSEGRKVFPWVE